MRFPAVILAALVGGCVATELPEGAGGPGFLARNGRAVYPLTEPLSFEVLPNPGDAGAQYFCAAGDFARVVLGARSSERVVLIAPEGNSTLFPGRRAAQFQVQPPGSGAPREGYSIDMRRPGESFTVGSAVHFCNKQPFSLF